MPLTTMSETEILALGYKLDTIADCSQGRQVYHKWTKEEGNTFFVTEPNFTAFVEVLTKYHFAQIVAYDIEPEVYLFVRGTNAVRLRQMSGRSYSWYFHDTVDLDRECTISQNFATPNGLENTLKEVK